MIASNLLPHTMGLIDGQWRGSSSRAGFDVIDPATGHVLAHLPRMGAADATAAVDAAARALGTLADLEVRRSWLTSIAQLMADHEDDLARIITLENGKPLRESHAEVQYAAGFFRFFAHQLDYLAPQSLPEKIRQCQWTIYHRPAGVVSLITPWNFPLAMLAKKFAPALGAGCALVIKPAEKTPLSAIALCELAQQAGVTPGVVNLVMGKSSDIGPVLCTHRAVRLVSFTGSTEVGRTLIHTTAPHVKRLALELGGNAPFIVFADADLDAAADHLIANKFRASGQTCVCTNRVYVHTAVADSFIAKTAQRMRELVVGNGLDPQTDVGPLINRDGWQKVAQHVRDAVEQGASLVVGELPTRPPAHDWGAFYQPTLLQDVTADMLVSREETFGPVVAIAEFDGDDQVITSANSTEYGLAAYVFTRDPMRAQRAIESLHFGHVGLNTGTGPTPEAPFGGMKQSGFGREGGVEGLLEFCDTQVVASEG